MIHARVGDETQSSLADPLPEHNILRHRVGLELPLGVEVEDLQRALGLEGNDVSGPVHDGAVGFDGPPGDAVAIVEVDDHNLS